MTKIIVTLTTIPSRAHAVHKTLQSIRGQSLKPDAIELYIPQAYRRPSLGAPVVPEVPDGCTIIRTDVDYGPGSKVIPAIARYKNDDVILIYVDDDHSYQPDLVEKLVAEHQRHPEACICGSGIKARDMMTRRTITKDWRYRLKRIASLGLWKVYRFAQTGVVDIAEGVGGVLVRPSFFDDTVYDIPDILWTVDDVWLSGIMAKNKVPVRLIKDQLLKGQPNAEHQIDALMNYSHHGVGRGPADVACMQYFQKHYGVWPDARPAGSR